MKKVVSFFTLQIPPGNYFLEDISYIYELLASNFEKVVIITDQFEFENLEEVKSYKEPIKRMSINAHNSLSIESFFSIEIDTWVRISSNSDTVLARGIAEKVADLAKKRVKPFNIFNRTPFLDLSDVIISAIFLGFPIAGFYFIKVNKPIVGSFFIGVSTLLFFWLIYVENKRKSTVKLIHKYESPNFFKANSDKIIIAIIAAIFGGIINFLISNFTK